MVSCWGWRPAVVISLTRPSSPAFPSGRRAGSCAHAASPWADGPCCMGIINVTPDSFSDGGYPRALGRRGPRLAAGQRGADLLDIGGESTRPYSQAVDTAEELRRVLPVVEAVCRQAAVPLSIDTSKPEVARESIAAVAEIINDAGAGWMPIGG